MKNQKTIYNIYSTCLKASAFFGILMGYTLISGTSLEILVSDKSSMLNAIFIIIGMYGSLIAILAHICRGQTWISRENQSRWIKNIIFLIGYVLLLGAISILFNLFNVLATNNYDGTSNQKIVNLMLANQQLKWFMMVQISVFAPFIEELMFRGVAVKWFFKNNIYCQWLLSAGLFALMHEQSAILAFLMYFCMGSILFEVKYKFGLLCSIGVHIIYNSCLLLLLL